MEFEAVLLDAHRGRANQLWIHARIKACVLPTDCEPVSAEVVSAGINTSWRMILRD